MVSEPELEGSYLKVREQARRAWINGLRNCENPLSPSLDDDPTEATVCAHELALAFVKQHRGVNRAIVLEALRLAGEILGGAR